MPIYEHYEVLVTHAKWIKVTRDFDIIWVVEVTMVTPVLEMVEYGPSK